MNNPEKVSAHKMNWMSDTALSVRDQVLLTLIGMAGGNLAELGRATKTREADRLDREMRLDYTSVPPRDEGHAKGQIQGT